MSGIAPVVHWQDLTLAYAANAQRESAARQYICMYAATTLRGAMPQRCEEVSPHHPLSFAFARLEVHWGGWCLFVFVTLY
jgi:hypothetical protein